MSHFRMIDQDITQVAKEAIHIRVSNQVLNCNSGQMHITGIFIRHFRVNRPSVRLDQAADPDQSQGYMHQTILSNRFSTTVVITLN